MNVGLITCVIMACLFFIIGMIFALGKEKAAILISGFNFKTKEERELYDVEKLSRDQRNLFFGFMMIFIVGAIGAYFISQYIAIVAVVVWLGVFFKNVHFDDEKAFSKYKK